ncbi:MAG: alpha/beta fold hydrolase [Proteobacteria bacterium]|nr:alpha/beta fold hydrolase [Pseudomonadota bacterium]
MSEALLPAIEIETGPHPTGAVIWLHGLGDTGQGWSDVVPALQVPPTLPLRFIFPHAPSMPVTINNGMRMPAWYDIKAANLNDRADIAGVQASMRAVDALIAREVSRGVVPHRIVLAGFSQGGAVALYAGLRNPSPLAGIVALSTYLVGGNVLAAEAAPQAKGVPIFMAHGLYDPVVRLEWAEASRTKLMSLGYNVEWHTYPMEHTAVLDEVAAIGAFLRRVLA